MFRRIISTAALVFGATAGPGLALAAEVALPRSFAEVAATALAASIVIRASEADAVAGDARPVPAQVDVDQDLLEDGWDPVDPLAARRNRTVSAGIIIDPRGVAVTSARALLGARRFEVVLIDETPVEAILVGIDWRTDVAVLRLRNDRQPFAYLPLGDSERVRAGDWVIAVGAPLGLQGTVVAGVITAIPALASESPLATYLQSETAMARGNPGGPLVNLNGEVVGLGTVLSGDGIAYALPSKTLRRVYLDLLEKGRVSRPWLGVATQSLTAELARALRAPDGTGALIADVRPEGPAAAGLLPGDIVIAVGTTPIASRTHFDRALSALTPGHAVALKVRRDGVTSIVSVKLGEEPEERRLPSALPRAQRRFDLDVRPLEPSAGAVARDVDVSSPAGRAGIRSGDVIREVNREPIRNVADFRAVVRALRPGTPVLMRVQRADVVRYVVVGPGE
jgi:serine protease Do